MYGNKVTISAGWRKMYNEKKEKNSVVLVCKRTSEKLHRLYFSSNIATVIVSEHDGQGMQHV
jgi:hypothetical protein